jgi:excisionase family DNA binding protein
MNREQLVALPAVVDVPTAASVLGLSRTTVYELIRIGDWPTPVLRLGKLIRLPTEPILELLGIQPATESPARSLSTDDAERRVG